jgi:hypothetical protein
MAGIRISGKGKAIIIGGNYEGNADGGVVLEDDSSAWVVGTKITKNHGDGISVSGDGSSLYVEDAEILNNGIEQAFGIIGIDKSKITEEQLKAIINKVLSENDNKKDKNTIIESVLSWANSIAIFATIADSEPLITAVSAVVAYGLSNLKSLTENL